MSKNVIAQARHIHCIGVGGIGVSALARKFLLEKKKVSGSDMHDSPLIHELRKRGACIYQGHNAKHIQKDTDVVIYTKAIQNNNPELLRAQELHIPCITYSQALGIMSDDMYTIAIAGSHGKTTTTGLIAWGLIQAKKDPTVIVGSLLTDIPTNFIAGKSKYFVVEACEYGKSFLDLQPKIAVITNIDNDHLDYYKTKENLIRAFITFAQKVPQDGYLITNLGDKDCARVARHVKCRVIDYRKGIIPAETKLLNRIHTIISSNILVFICLYD